MRIALVIMSLCIHATCQNIQITGGDSSLFRAQGGQVHAFFANSETAVSAGMLDGHAYVGVVEKFEIHDWKINAGDVNLPFSLPTDFLPNSNFQAPAIGVIASHKWGLNKITLFTGATASTYQVPFFFGSHAETPTAGLFYERDLSTRWTFLSSNVVSLSKQSSIQSLRFKPTERTSLAASTGIGNNSPFVGLRAAYETQRLTGIVAWTKRGSDFQRIVLPYTVTENNGLEAHGSYMTQHFNVTADRQNLLSDIRGTVIDTTVESLSTGGSIWILSGSSSIFYGRSNGMLERGKTAGVGAMIGPVTGRFDWFASAGHTTQAVSLTEKVSRHLSVSQFIQRHSINAGAEWHSNLLTISGGYSMSYFAALGQFQKVLSIGLSIQLPHNLRLDAGTITLPDGRTKWTAYANTYQRGPLSDVSDDHATGKYLYTGKCVTPKGEPVACAVQIGKGVVFANAKGEFKLPSNKRKALTMAVMPDQFIDPGQWIIVTAPTTITPEAAVTITVKRVQIRANAASSE